MGQNKKWNILKIIIFEIEKTHFFKSLIFKYFYKMQKNI